MRNPFKRAIDVIRTLREHRIQPLRLEFVVTDYCNLNCVGCTHYSPLAPKEFEPIEQLERETAHLGHVCGDKVKKVYLIGGETLLYPDLIRAMEIISSNFPDSKRYIFTNGLLLPRMADEFWTTARETHTIIAITRYPINFDYDATIDLCRTKGVETEVFGDRSMKDSFFRFALDPTGSQNGRVSHFKCYNRGCISITGGKIYPCSISACVGHLNRAFSTNFEHRDGDYINVMDVKSSRDIKRLRDRAVPFCRYCKLPPASVKYHRSERKAEEWVDNFPR